MRFRALLLTATAVVALVLVASSATIQGQQARGKAALLVNIAEIKDQAPAMAKVQFDTSKGAFVVQVHRDWAPIGADRFYTLANRGYYDGNRFFRVTDILAQFGINGDPEVSKHWIGAKIPDDQPGKQTNKRGTIAFMQANFRRTQTFINKVDNSILDRQVSPFGEVVSGMDVIDRLTPTELSPAGDGPTLTDIFQKGTPFLEKQHPNLDYVKMATVVP
jgi:peptidyl-prolyl cis-trans isomerase A (cyclophilin A)